MKIAFITPEFVTEEKSFDGGLANYLNRVTISLRDMGHKPVVFVVSDDPTNTFSKKGVEVHRVNTTQKSLLFNLEMKLKGKEYIGPLTWKYNSKALNNYLRNIDKEYKFDIVQYASYTATALYRVRNIPSVMRISSYDPLMKQHQKDTTMTDIDRYRQQLERKSILNVDRVFAPSKLLANTVKDELDINRVDVMKNPFTLDTKPGEYDFSVYKANLQKMDYFLFFGSIRYLKGVQTITDILPELLNKNNSLRFLFVGKDSWNYMKKIKEVVGGYGDRVLWFDKLEHEKLYPIIENAKAVVLPSRVDNIPNACLESMALGKIVVGVREASFSELIEDGEDGFLINRDDSASLLKKLENIIHMNENDYEQISKKAQVSIQKYSPNRIIPKLINYYQEVIDEFK